VKFNNYYLIIVLNYTFDTLLGVKMVCDMG